MAEVKAFKGLVYNPDRIRDSSLVVAPPYDIISSKGQDELYEKDPHNVVRLELAKDEAGDGEGSNRYTRAAKTLDQWVKDGVLSIDEKPSLYLTHIRYSIKGEERLLRGFICLIRLEEFGTGTVLPHENTLSGPKTDRLNLIRATSANFSQIFSLYSDPEKLISATLESAHVADPMIEITDDAGYIHRVWRVTDQDAVDTVQGVLRGKPIFIADGHHRYETALNYCREQGGDVAGGADESFRYVMMFLSNMDDDGLTVLPTHRVVREVAVPPVAELLEQLGRYFITTCLDENVDVMERMAQAGPGHHIGMVSGEDKRGYLLSLKDTAVMDEIFGDSASKAFKQLDVTILQSLILDRILGITPDMLREHRYVHFIKNPEDAVDATKKGDYSIAFLLNPTKIEEVRDVAAAGEKMPQKSTYFYPKLLTGLVMYRM